MKLNKYIMLRYVRSSLSRHKGFSILKFIRLNYVVKFNLLLITFFQFTIFVALASDRMGRYNACIAGKESVYSPDMGCTMTTRGQDVNACYAYSSIGIFRRALIRAGVNAPWFSPECAAIFFFASQLQSMNEVDWNNYLNTVRNGHLLAPGRDDKMLDWVLKNPKLPTEVQCNSQKLESLNFNIQKIALEENPISIKGKIEQELLKFTQETQSYVSPIGGKNLFYRVHSWETSFSNDSKTQKQCLEQTNMLKHYLCAEIPVSMVFIKSKGCTTRDNFKNECQESETSIHASIAYGINDKDGKIQYIESANRAGLDPSKGLMGSFSLEDTCRIGRITALMNNEDYMFLKEVETSRNQPLLGLIDNKLYNYSIDSSSGARVPVQRKPQRTPH